LFLLLFFENEKSERISENVFLFSSLFSSSHFSHNTFINMSTRPKRARKASSKPDYSQQVELDLSGTSSDESDQPVKGQSTHLEQLMECLELMMNDSNSLQE